MITANFFFLLFLLNIIPLTLYAQESWKVGVKHTPPFIIVEKGKPLKGFSIDLINEIAKRMEQPVSVEFIINKDLPDQLNKVKNGEVQLGISATSITAERIGEMDFSVNFFKGGLGILTTSDSKISIWKTIFSKQVGMALGIVVLYIIFCANIIWLLERKSDSFSSKWQIGVLEGIWWTIVTMSTVGYGDFVPKSTISRLFSILVIFSGIMLFSVAIGALSSLMTISSLKSEINGPNDLMKRKIAAPTGSTASRYMKSKGAYVKETDNLQDGLELLMNKKVVAVVYDMPILKYLVNQDKEGNFMIVGRPFNEEFYGISFPLNSPLRQRINVQLLKIKSSPVYRQIYQKWFGISEE